MHRGISLWPNALIYPHHWESYKANLISKVKELKDVTWTGDGRFDSMGHNAKYGVYTMLCTTIMKIVLFELVQVNDFSTTKNINFYYLSTCEIPGFLLLLKNHIFIACNKDTIFIFHM